LALFGNKIKVDSSLFLLYNIDIIRQIEKANT
jgi:hypothetical protein